MSVVKKKRTAAVEIPTLPDDCLRVIFLHLTVLERVKLRKVCRQWREVSDDCWSQVEALEVVSGCDKNEVVGDGRRVEVLAKSQEFGLKITELCARHIKEFTYLCSEEFDPFPGLAEARKIEHLKFVVDDWEDRELGKLFTRNPNIKKLELKMSKRHRCLGRLKTGSLRSLYIKADDCLLKSGRKRFMEILAKKVREAPLLESLNLYNLNDDKVLEALQGNANLRELYMLQNFDYLTLDGLSYIGKLSNLRILSIMVFDGTLIVDDFLWSLRDCVELKLISIGDVERITNRGLKALSQLPKLRQVGMMKVSRITDGGLLYLTNLEMLSIWESKVTTEGVIELIRTSSTLHSLGLSGKNLNVDKLKKAIAEILKERETPLTCYANSVQISGRPKESS